MTIELRPHAEGAILPVRAQAGGRRNALRGTQNGMLKVSVTQAAEKGKANAAIARVLCQALSLRPSQVELLAGHTASHKQFLITGIAIEALRERMTAALAESGE